MCSFCQHLGRECCEYTGVSEAENERLRRRKRELRARRALERQQQKEEQRKLEQQQKYVSYGLPSPPPPTLASSSASSSAPGRYKSTTILGADGPYRQRKRASLSRQSSGFLTYSNESSASLPGYVSNSPGCRPMPSSSRWDTALFPNESDAANTSGSGNMYGTGEASSSAPSFPDTLSGLPQELRTTFGENQQSDLSHSIAGSAATSLPLANTSMVPANVASSASTMMQWSDALTLSDEAETSSSLPTSGTADAREILVSSGESFWQLLARSLPTTQEGNNVSEESMSSSSPQQTTSHFFQAPYPAASEGSSASMQATQSTKGFDINSRHQHSDRSLSLGSGVTPPWSDNTSTALSRRESGTVTSSLFAEHGNGDTTQPEYTSRPSPSMRLSTYSFLEPAPVVEDIGYTLRNDTGHFFGRANNDKASPGTLSSSSSEPDMFAYVATPASELGLYDKPGDVHCGLDVMSKITDTTCISDAVSSNLCEVTFHAKGLSLCASAFE